jgi:hypothetical protein
MAINTDTKYSPTSSLGYAGADSSKMLPLAYHRPRSMYKPQYGDFIIWSKWFNTWYGVVKHFDVNTNELHVIFEGLPILLFTMSEEEQAKETYRIKLSDIKDAKNGKYSILQNDQQARDSIWYI